MAFDEETVKIISAWSDLVSMSLLVLSLVSGGFSPSRKVWGRPWQRNLAQVLTFSVAVAWSIFRFVIEGIFKEAGPREFLVGTVVYLGRWLWLWWRMTRSQSKEARIFEVARALRKLHTLRIGFSTDVSKHSQGTKDWEAVLRYGTPDRQPGKSYWRGVITKNEFCPDVKTWEVHLAERKLYADKLDKFGTLEYMMGDQKCMNIAYQAFYEVVMNAVAYRPLFDKEEPNKPPVPGDGYFDLPPPQTVRNVMQKGGSNRATAPSQVVNGTAEVNFDPFFDKWDALPAEWVARSVGAVDQRPIGWVARRVAADAIVYIKQAGKSLHTEKQVERINDCLKATLNAHFRYDTPEHVALDLDASVLKRS